MEKYNFRIGGYLVAATLGATSGGIAVAIGSKALPSMMSDMMSTMMGQMGAEGCDPEEM